MDAAAYPELADTEDRHWWYAARRAVARAHLRRLPLPPPDRARVLEIGCGTGGNLGLLARFGRLSACELDAQARDFAQTKAHGLGLDIPIREGRLPAPIPAAPGSLDLICLFDVLEHVDDDEAALRALRALLAPGGHILLTVPAHPWLWSAHDDYLHHRRRYRLGELAAKARRAGFTIHHLGWLNAALFPLAAVSRLLTARRQGRPPGTALPPPWLNRLLYRVSAAERLLAPGWRLPWGLSLLAVLRRPDRD